MKIVALVALMLGGCASGTGSVDFETSDITYYRDGRTSLCFAAVGSKSALSASSTGLGMTQVPCSKTVLALVEN